LVDVGEVTWDYLLELTIDFLFKFDLELLAAIDALEELLNY
jgi:hypothetical protein